MTHTTETDKRVLIEPETQKAIPIEGDKPAQTIWALYLLVRKWPRPKAHSYVSQWGSKDCIPKSAFSSNYILNQHSGSQSVVPRPGEAATSLGNLLEMQIFGPYPKCIALETLRVGHSSEWFWNTIRFENHWYNPMVLNWDFTLESPR